MYRFLGYLQEDREIVSLLSKCHLHIIPELDPNGLSNARIGDCSGAMNNGTSEFHSLSLEVLFLVFILNKDLIVF